MNASRDFRGRKRQGTRKAISDAAIKLFLNHGFDQVSVADIATMARVSKPTLFKYFRTKEELVVHQIAEQRTLSCTVVAGRPPGMSAIGALYQHFLDGLADRDAITGLNDDPGVVAFYSLVYSTPRLVERANLYLAQAEEPLAGTLVDALDPGTREITGALLAGQVIVTERALASANWQRIAAGRSADELYPEAVDDAHHAFSLLRHCVAGIAP